MTNATLIDNHQAAIKLLIAALVQNELYAKEFGYPSGKTCPHCGKEVFTNPQSLDDLAARSGGTGLAHDHCHIIAGLQVELQEARNAKPTLTLVQMPNAQEEPEPVQTPTSAPEETQPWSAAKSGD